MTVATAEIQGRQIKTLSQFFTEEPERGIRRACLDADAKIPTNDARRKAARARWLREGENIVLALEAKQAENDQKEAIRVERKSEVEAAADSAMRQKYKRAAGIMGSPRTLFDGTPGAMVETGDKLAVRPDGEHCIIVVDADQAAALESRYGIGETLTWESAGKRCYAFSRLGTGVKSLMGHRVSACCEESFQNAGTQHLIPALAPIESKSNWVVPVARALPKSGRAWLPKIPPALVTVLEAAHGAAPDAFDRLVLG